MIKKIKKILELIALSFVVAIMSGPIFWGFMLLLLEFLNLIQKVTGGTVNYYSLYETLLLSILVMWFVFFIVLITLGTDDSKIVSNNDLNENTNNRKLSRVEKELLIRDGYKFRRLIEDYKELYELNFYKEIAKEIQEEVFNASKEGKKYWEATSEIHKDFLSKFPHVLWYSGEVIAGKSVEGQIHGNMVIW